MNKLPGAFTERMEQLLGDEYPAFLASYEQPRRYGLRVNTSKISPEAFEALSDFHLTKLDAIPGAYAYEEADGAARHPYYHAGLYYLQEPSAMTPASVLPVNPGDKVLDLCAAPGGKATALGAKLQGSGLLVANDLSASRCKALLKNLEVFGIPNLLVTNEPPVRLEERFPEFFDKILVDAPCSGEGMFRKDENTIRAWYPEKPAECAAVQREIILRAAGMLRPGGQLLYSTCTFSLEENEEIIRYLLEQCPDMRLCPIPERPGFSEGLAGLPECVRLWPHKTGGEGHFLALLTKAGEEGTAAAEQGSAEVSATGRISLDGSSDISEAAEAAQPAMAQSLSEKYTEKTEAPVEKPRKIKAKDRRRGKAAFLQESGGRGKRINGQGAASIREKAEAVERFFANTALPRPAGRIDIRGEMAIFMPDQMPQSLAGITFLRAGLLAGQFRSDRFEPSQALAMAIRLPGAETLRAEAQSAEENGKRSAEEKLPACVLSMKAEDPRMLHYLRGETISLEPGEEGIANGWVLVCADGYPVGWAKRSGMLLKNKYLAGWRTKY